MAAITRVGLTGSMAAYGTFQPKSAGASAQTRRGIRAKGRARNRGRTVIAFLVAVAGLLNFLN